MWSAPKALPAHGFAPLPIGIRVELKHFCRVERGLELRRIPGKNLVAMARQRHSRAAANSRP